ncbi:MAG TPA: glycoside hydrolase family 2 TIM barrel-domain containing protein [Aestuariivirgaceae bacterium]|jgi:hypothetical protein
MNVRSDAKSESLRRRLSLDGEWEFQHDDGPWRSIGVPGVWQAQFDDLRLSGGRAVYRTHFALPLRQAGRDWWIRFDAVNYFATVRLNGILLGENEGGWLPFEYALPDNLLREENDLEVLVELPGGAAECLSGRPCFAQIPHGKQSWYGPLAGIWQSVWLEERANTHIRECRIRTQLGSGLVEIEVTLSGTNDGLSLDAWVLAPDGSVAARVNTEPQNGEAIFRFRVSNPLPWSHLEPRLYRINLQLTRLGEKLDKWQEAVGFRSIETKGGKFFLNGEPLYLRGALDQDYYADLLLTPPSLEFIEDQLRKAKALGLNCLRCHIKVPDPRYYEAADRLGMLIWTEIPNFAEYSDAAVERLWSTMKGILRRDGNHPSIIAWTIVNEDWGTELDEDPDHRRWLAQCYARLKALDPTRLVVDNSPCFPNFHMRTDINDFHYYRAIPDHRGEWDLITQQFASRPSWAFAPDGEQTGEEPLVVSEFGVWGLPHPKLLRDEKGREPWWFETGELFGDGVAYPRGAERRFSLLGLERVFGSFDAFIDATQQHQFTALKYQIEKLREYQSIQGYVVTELTDVYWEANGLMDMRRNLRSFADEFAELNRDIVLLPRIDRHAFWGGETLRLSPAVATGASRLEDGGVMDWSLVPGGPSGRLEVDAAEACTVVSTRPLETTAPALDRPSMLDLQLVLRDRGGLELAQSSTPLAFYPPRAPRSLPAIWSADEEIAVYFGGLGYGRAATAKSADVVIVRAVNTADVESIRTGGRYLLLADGPGSDGWLRSDHPVQAAVPTIPAPVNPPFPGIMRRIRRGNVWRGDWITNFGWLARRGAFADIPGGPMLDLSFDRVVPDHVLWASIRPWEYEAGIMPAGVVVGWVHKPAGYMMLRRFGRGKLVMTTFRLMRDPPGADPVASALVDRLIETALEA